MDHKAIRTHLEFCRELGVKELAIPATFSFRPQQVEAAPPALPQKSATPSATQPQGPKTATPTPNNAPWPPPRPASMPASAPSAQQRPPMVASAPAAMPQAAPRVQAASQAASDDNLFPELAVKSAPKSSPTIHLPSVAPDNDSFELIQSDIGDCKRCRLCEQRNKIVFGVGNPQSPLVFVGEGPGADEDMQGIPFVGRAGQLLTQMIEGTASREGIPIKRADVYIANVVKCRPPENRTPLPDEMEMCGQFLFRQLMVIKPKAICALGGTAAKALLGVKEGITRLRGNWQTWRDIPVMPTYHPSFLLRPYSQNAKRESWEDLKKLLHFVYD